MRDLPRAARTRARHWIEILARAGYVAKGLVYLGAGALSAWAALVSGSTDAEGSREALTRLGRTAPGELLLGLVAAGMVGYVCWRLVQVFGDPEGRGTDARALATRAVLLFSALAYASLALWIVRSLIGSGAGDGGSGARSWSATLLGQPYGAWLLGASGLAVAGYGVGEWVKAARADFEKRMRPELKGSVRVWVRRIARSGLVARGIVFLMIGAFLVHAARTADPSQVRGLEGALEALGRTAAGPWLMGLVAAGVGAYGVLQGVKAWYRRIEVAA